MKVKPTIIGICGGSCSGKTYFTEKIEHHFLPSKVSTVSQDNYYKDLSGLSIEIREKNNHENFVVNQLEKYSDINEGLIFAYEPIWAIGTGKIPTISDIGKMINVIKDNVPSDAKVLYGGSVNAKNASNLLAIDNLDGLLVGGASLNPVEFANIAQS